MKEKGPDANRLARFPVKSCLSPERQLFNKNKFPLSIRQERPNSPGARTFPVSENDGHRSAFFFRKKFSNDGPIAKNVGDEWRKGLEQSKFSIIKI